MFILYAMVLNKIVQVINIYIYYIVNDSNDDIVNLTKFMFRMTKDNKISVITVLYYYNMN